MVLHGIGKFKSTQEIFNFFPIPSTWTVDLAFILKHCEIDDFVFYTTHLGVNWEHVKIPFYKETYDDDRQRIHALFRGAAERRVNIVARKVTLEEIREFLGLNRYAIILLVDLNLLSCQLCSEKQRKDYWKSWWWSAPTDKAIQPHNPVSAQSSQATAIGGSPGNTTPSRKHSKSYSSPSSSICSYSQSQSQSQYHPSSVVEESTPLLTPKLNEETGCLSICKWFGRRGYDMVKSVEFVGHYIVLIG
jgi:hypothetical protein